MTSTYKPQANSPAGKTLAFFKAVPDEELTSYDLAEKFEVNHKNIHTLLRPAVDAGLLVRDRDDEGYYTYKAGPNLLNDTSPDKPPAKPPAAPQAKAGTPNQLFTPTTGYSLDLIARLPVTSGREFCTNSNTKGISKWTPLMMRLTKTGDSVSFPPGWRNAVTKAALKFNRDHKSDPATDFKYRITSHRGESILWRLPK